MKIHLPAYLPGVHRIEETLESKDLDLAPEIFVSGVLARLILDRHDPYCQFQFHLETTVRLVCDRCAAPFETAITIDAPMLYVIGKLPANIPDDPEISYLPTGTIDIDLTNDLRDFMMLALPGKNLCSEDCKGLCSQCGADLNETKCSCVKTDS